MIKLVKILFEGGFSSEKTIGIKLTPQIVAQAIKLFEKFINEFNNFLNKKNYPPIKMYKLIGSAAYYKNDLKSNLEKEYGDIDVSVEYPLIITDEDSDLKNENASRKIYNDLLLLFLKKQKLSYVYTKDMKNNPSILILKLNNTDYVQIDIRPVFKRLKNWVIARYTPEYGIKGKASGQIFTALGKVINTKFEDDGVMLRLKDNELVPYGIKIYKANSHLISKNKNTFMLDLLKFLVKKINKTTDIKINPLLQKYKGFNTGDFKISDLILSIKGFAKSLELNNLFKKSIFSHINNYDDFIDKFKKQYIISMEKALSSHVFDTDISGEKAEATRDKIKKDMEYVLSLIKKYD